jgi:predicted flap endonuclease-1-like 5' DNA nuclease
MIWHFFEVWMVLLLAFVVGGGLGAALYSGLDRTALAPVQGRLADSIGDTIDGIKATFGLGPDWRDGVRPPVERPSHRKDPEDRLPPNEEPIEPRAPSWVTEAEYDDDRIARRNWDTDEEWLEDEDYVSEEPVEAGSYAMEGTVGAQPTPPPELAEDVTAKRPVGLAAPRNGVPDNLQRIRGIGKRNEDLLNGLGIYHFGQIAAWTPAEIRWVATYLAFPDRIERDDWVGQATVLASGGNTGFVKSSARRRERRIAARTEDPDENDG